MRKNKAKAKQIDVALSKAQTAVAQTFDDDVYTSALGVDANEIWSAIEDFRRKLAHVIKHGK
jgi:hypothetical protein